MYIGLGEGWIKNDPYHHSNVYFNISNRIYLSINYHIPCNIVVLNQKANTKILLTKKLYLYISLFTLLKSCFLR